MASREFPKPVRVGDHVSEFGGQKIGEVISIAGRYLEIRMWGGKGNTGRLQKNVIVTSRLCNGVRYYTYAPEQWDGEECLVEKNYPYYTHSW